MASKAVVDAVTARYAAWTAAPIFGPNEISEAPANKAEYVLVDYPLSDSASASFGAPGANIWREEGVFRFIIHVKRSNGIGLGLQWADELAALFRGKEFDGVQTFAPSPPVTDDDSENGKYFLLAVAVPYRFDLIG